MPVTVKDYLNSMNAVSFSAKAQNNTASSTMDTKTQALLSQLIEAIAYTKSMDFRQKTLNKQVDENTKGKDIVKQLQSQEKLIAQLIDGEKLSAQQSKDLTAAIDKFYELAGATEVNYKKFAEQLEKFALKTPLPEPVQTRLINDSRDAHMIGKEQQDTSGVILPILKKIKFLLEDSAEASKQFTKKLFVTLDDFREGFLKSFENLKDGLKESGGIFSNIIDAIKMAGMAWMFFQGQFKEGKFGFAMAFKQFENIKKLFKVAKEVGSLKGLAKFSGVAELQKGFKSISAVFKSFMSLPKEMKTLKNAFGFLKAGGSGFKMISKGLGKNALKKIPLFGTIMSVWMGIERWKKKDYLGAFLEFGSGVAAMFPGVGTLISIGIDLINLSRDAKIIPKAAEWVKSKLNDNFLLGIPVVGPIFGLNKAMKMFKAGDKLGAMKMGARALVSIIPGAGTVWSIIEALFNNKEDFDSTENTNVPERRGWFNFGKKSKAPYGDGPWGDGPIKWQNDTGGYSPKGLTASAKTAAENLNNLTGGNMVVTSAFRDPSKMMAEWNAARPIPGSRNRINRWGNEMADPRRSNHAKGLAIDVPMGMKTRLGGKFNMLARKAGFTTIYPERTAVHLEVPGSGKVSKVDSKDMKGMSSAEPLYEDSQVIASAEGEEPQTFADILSLFNKFNEDLNAQLAGSSSSADVTGRVSPASNGPSAPSIDVMSAGTPQATTASASAVTAKATSVTAANSTAQAPVQVQTTMAPGTQSTMDTEIRDTDLALLNSLLFQ